MRATHPVCSIRVSRRLAKRSDARQKIVFPQKKYFLQLRNNRSTRIPEFQTNQPDARNLCAASHDTTRFRYLSLLSPAGAESRDGFSPRIGFVLIDSLRVCNFPLQLCCRVWMGSQTTSYRINDCRTHRRIAGLCRLLVGARDGGRANRSDMSESHPRRGEFPADCWSARSSSSPARLSHRVFSFNRIPLRDWFLQVSRSYLSSLTVVFERPREGFGGYVRITSCRSRSTLRSQR